MAGLISGVLRGVGDLLFRRLNPLTIPKRRENAQAVREFQRSTASFDETDLFQYPLASGNDMKVPNGLRVARLVVMCNKGTMAVHTGRIADAAASAFREYCTEKGFVFHDRPYQLNIFGLRNVSRESGTFDDNVCLLFRDDRGWVLEVYVATTDPGTAWLVKGGPTGRGTAILVPGQYEDTYDVAKHKGKYNALCQRPGKSVAVWRDNNRDDKLDFRGPKDVGVFWINIHNGGIPNARSYANRSLTIKDLVRKYSAGCQVIATQADFKNFMGQVYKSQRHGYRTFTYTLLDEGHDAFRRRIQRALGGGGYTAPAPSAPPAPPAAQWSPPPPAPAAAAAEGRKVHVVGQGDTLWGISRAYGVSVADLERCNPGLSSDIHPGDKISIP